MDEHKTTGAGTPATNETNEQKTKPCIKRFTAKRIALMAISVALSYAISLLDFPIFPATPYLKLDFGNVFILLISFLLGPVEGVVDICICRATQTQGL